MSAASPSDKDDDSRARTDSPSTTDTSEPLGSAQDVLKQSDAHRQSNTAASTPAYSHGDFNESGPASRASPEALDSIAPSLEYKMKLILRGHTRGVSMAKFSPDGQLLASCSADATLRVWDAVTGILQHTLRGHLAGISTLAWAPDSLTIASGSDDKAIRFWDAVAGTPKMSKAPDGTSIPRKPLLGHHNYIYSVAFSPKGNMLASSSYDEAICIWDVRSGTLLRTLPAHSDPIGSVDFVHDGTLIASCASDGLIRVWDTATGQCLRTFFHEDTPPVVSVKFTPNGKYIIAWMLDSCLRMWNYVEGRCVKTYQGHVNHKYSLAGAFGTYNVDHIRRPFLASGSEDGQILLWDVVSKQILQKIDGHEGIVLCVDVHPSAKILASCGTDTTIRIWQA